MKKVLCPKCGYDLLVVGIMKEVLLHYQFNNGEFVYEESDSYNDDIYCRSCGEKIDNKILNKYHIAEYEVCEVE